jgi:hypothetical protein
VIGRDEELARLFQPIHVEAPSSRERGYDPTTAPGRFGGSSSES